MIDRAPMKDIRVDPEARRAVAQPDLLWGEFDRETTPTAWRQGIPAVHGGLAQGIAQALLEEVVYDAGGELLTGSLLDDALPAPPTSPPSAPTRL